MKPRKFIRQAQPIDLHAHSMFSVLDGAGSPEMVVARAKELGWNSACLTEHGNLMSVPSFYKACRKEGINPILGMEAYVVPDDNLGINNKETQKSYHLTMLALSKEGYQNLIKWSTFANRKDAEAQNFYYRPRISFSAMLDLAPYPLHHNVVFSGCLSGELLRFINNSNGNGWKDASVAYLDMMRSIFPNFFIEIQNHKLDKYVGKGFTSYEDLLKIEKKSRSALVELHELTGIPLVVTNDSHMQRASQRKSHIALKAATWKKHGEGEMDSRSHAQMAQALDSYGYFANYMRPLEEVADGLPAEYRSAALDNVIEIVREADVRLDVLDKQSVSIPFSGYNDPEAIMRKRSKSRLNEVIKEHGQSARDRFNVEMETVGDFGHYMLIVSDIVRWCKKQGILVNTRGSAANSLVCYCLGIHDIDPMPGAYDLLFSRFVNPARKKLPDIDLDIERDRYEDVVRFVKEYIAEREGPGQVVQICNLGTLANRSAFRMVAETLGLDKDVIDEISRLLPSMIDSGMVDEEEDVYVTLKEEYPDIYELASGVFDSIKSISQHACGWLVGTKDRPIEEWVPLCLIPSSGATVTQFDMKALEDLGLTKLDLLRLKTLSVVQRTRKQLGHSSLDITDIPLDDPDTFKMLRQGRVEGVFTLQGKENRRGVMEIEAETVHDVIKSVAIYRPALTREHKDVTYNLRRKGLEKVTYPDKIARKVLGPTQGIAVFQEQAMELGYEVGLDDAGVDDLYQAIKKAKGQGRGAKEAFAKIKPQFMEAARSNGIKGSVRKELWEIVKSFAGYGFNKGHATSYGILAVRAAYLKCHHPQEFFSALLDVYPEKSKYIAAARAEGFKFLPPDVNLSRAGFSKGDSADTIRVGLARIAGLGGASVEDIVKKQPFVSFDDFRDRTTSQKINVTRVKILEAIGALDSMGVQRAEDFYFEKKRNKKIHVYDLHGYDAIELFLLGFCLRTPEVFEGIKAQYTNKRDTGTWKHLGLDNGCEPLDGAVSVSKLFWVPKLGYDDLIAEKASSWAKVKTVLLTAVDVNGLPFEVRVSSDKNYKADMLKYLAKKAAKSEKGVVVCLDGATRQPFVDTDGPMSYSFFNVTGAFKDQAQAWTFGDDEDEVCSDLATLTRKATRR